MHQSPAPLTVQDVVSITGAPTNWCKAIFTEWRALLEQGINEDQRRGMVLSLLCEAEAISPKALAIVQSSGDERLQVNGLKIALDSLKRRQSLLEETHPTINQVSISVNGPIEVTPFTFNLDVCLIYIPAFTKLPFTTFSKMLSDQWSAFLFP